MTKPAPTLTLDGTEAGHIRRALMEFVKKQNMDADFLFVGSLYRLHERVSDYEDRVLAHEDELTRA